MSSRPAPTLATALALALGPGAAPAPGVELGATVAPGGDVTFRVYSGPATRIEVWIYAQPRGAAEKLALPLAVDPASRVWSRTVAAADLRAKGVPPTFFFGYRAWGPNWPHDPAWTPGSAVGFIGDFDAAGNRFNPNKLLIDPHARESSHDPRDRDHPDGSVYLSGPDHRTRDSGPVAPKGVVLAFDAIDRTPTGTQPRRTLRDEVIYEVHVRGLTMNDPSVPPAERGTYAGAARKVPYLKELGVTAIEFLPIFDLQNDQNGLHPGSAEGDNYWGYDPNGFFAPDRRYAADRSWGGPTREFRRMVRLFHDAGIKVFLDVVYNHTGESGVDPRTGAVGQVRSWRGLDNAAYFEIRDDNAHDSPGDKPTVTRPGAFYANNNGVGPNVNIAHPATRDLVLDSLRYWTGVMGVDGFRFDLGALLGNKQTRGGFTFDPDSPDGFLRRAARDLPARRPDGSGFDLIAEPYGAKGEGTFQLGKFPPGWAEWNDRYRYPMRRKMNRADKPGNEVTPRQLALLVAGSPDLFEGSGRRADHGVNYLVCHDGFTLRDLFSYNGKRNDQPWPLGPSDGGTDDGGNLGWDQDGDPARQRQAARTALALLMVARGVPLLVGGDELYRTQHGNNNPYNLDNDRFYLDHGGAKEFPHHFAFTRAMIRFRADHPALRRADFPGATDRGRDITVYRDDGREADAAYLDSGQNHFLAWRIDGAASRDPAASIYVAWNAYWADIATTLPPTTAGRRWYLAVDTAARLEGRDNVERPSRRLDGKPYPVAARSVAIFVEKP